MLSWPRFGSGRVRSLFEDKWAKRITHGPGLESAPQWGDPKPPISLEIGGLLCPSEDLRRSSQLFANPRKMWWLWGCKCEQGDATTANLQLLTGAFHDSNTNGVQEQRTRISTTVTLQRQCLVTKSWVGGWSKEIRRLNRTGRKMERFIQLRWRSPFHPETDSRALMATVRLRPCDISF